MEKSERSLNIQQACESAPNFVETVCENSVFEDAKAEKISEESREAAKRFGGLSVGCFVYAFIYAFCMYRNKEGITYPFFIGTTLYFFYYYTKKYCGIIRKNDRFLVVSIIILGVLTCTTASPVIILCNKWLILLLVSVMVLRTYFDVTQWNISNYLSSIFYLGGGTFIHMFAPFFDVSDFIKIKSLEKGKTLINEKTKRIVFAVSAGVVLSIPMLFVIGALLGEADVYFEYYFYETLDFIFDRDFDFSKLLGDIGGFTFCVLFMFLASYGLFTYMSRKNGIEDMIKQKSEKWDCIIAITFTFLIGVMYLVFVWIQIAGLFMGALKLPYGYSYAEYARQGFFQLVFVCIFNVVLVLVCINCFGKHKVLQAFLTVISLCTYVMLVSSAYRMFLYIGEYHLTFLRILVLWGIVVIAFVMTGVIVSIYKERFPLFSYMLVAITCLYIAFAGMHPDYFITKYNVAQAQKGENIDEWYLTKKLSLDASIPLLEMYEEKLQTDVFADYNSELEDMNDYYKRIVEETKDMNLRSYNISKGIAKTRADNFMKNWNTIIK